MGSLAEHAEAPHRSASLTTLKTAAADVAAEQSHFSHRVSQKRSLQSSPQLTRRCSLCGAQSTSRAAGLCAPGISPTILQLLTSHSCGGTSVGGCRWWACQQAAALGSRNTGCSHAPPRAVPPLPSCPPARCRRRPPPPARRPAGAPRRPTAAAPRPARRSRRRRRRPRRAASGAGRPLQLLTASQGQPGSTAPCSLVGVQIIVVKRCHVVHVLAAAAVW